MKDDPVRFRATSILPMAALLALAAPTLLFADDGPVFPGPLGDVEVPLPEDLDEYVASMPAALALGKLFFWDLQVGSNGQTACASCHFQAGADPRIQNQLAPGDGENFDSHVVAGAGPNTTLTAADFPFRQLLNPHDSGSPVIIDRDDRHGSQGMYRRVFNAVVPGVGPEIGVPVPDPPFTIAGTKVRAVTPRNTPTVINAVYMHRLNLGGHAQNEFDGNGIFGPLNPVAQVLVEMPDGTTQFVKPAIKNAAIAAQATGPLRNPVEMSWLGRDIEQTGRKILAARPLLTQEVHPEDSVLGPYSNSPAKGITWPGFADVRYADLVREAFHPKFWQSAVLTGPDDLTQMEVNFPLFWGLAHLVYQSTLISPNSRYDQWAAAGHPADGGGILTAQELEGRDLFFGRGRCAECHQGPEFAGATVRELGCADPENGERAKLLLRMAMADGIAEGELVMRFGYDAPYLDYGPGSEFEDLIEPACVAEEDYIDLPFDPRGQLIEVRRPDTTGAPLALGSLMGTAQGCSPQDVCGELAPGSNAPPEGSNFTATWRYRRDETCNAELRVRIRWEYPGLPPGDYWVVVGGFNAGTIHMGHVEPQAIYDNGFYNIGVRPSEEDEGAAEVPFFSPAPFLSFAQRAVHGEDVGADLDPPAQPGERVAVHGAIRAVSLRNVELTGPYMHNGGFSTLEQVIDFYIGGSHFAEENSHDLDPRVAEGIPDMTPERKAALVAFLKTLTDEDVRHKRAPFDHPELRFPLGALGNEAAVVDSGNGEAVDVEGFVAPVGRFGTEAISSFHMRLAPGVTIAAPPGGLVADESAGSEPGTLTIALSKPLDGELELGLTVSDASQVELEPAQLSFGADDWFVPRTVTVHAREDGQVDGDRTVALWASLVDTTDPDWDALAPRQQLVLVRDSGVEWTRVDLEAEAAAITGDLLVLQDASASSGACVTTSEDLGDAAAGAGGQLSVAFDVSHEGVGTWRAWLLGSGPDAGSDSFWARVDDGAWRQVSLFRRPDARWAWTAVELEGFELSAGPHVLQLQHREDGAAVDRLILTDDPRFVPRGAPLGRAVSSDAAVPADAGPGLRRP